MWPFLLMPAQCSTHCGNSLENEAVISIAARSRGFLQIAKAFHVQTVFYYVFSTVCKSLAVAFMAATLPGTVSVIDCLWVTAYVYWLFLNQSTYLKKSHTVWVLRFHCVLSLSPIRWLKEPSAHMANHPRSLLMINPGVCNSFSFYYICLFFFLSISLYSWIF